MIPAGVAAAAVRLDPVNNGHVIIVTNLAICHVIAQHLRKMAEVGAVPAIVRVTTAETMVTFREIVRRPGNRVAEVEVEAATEAVTTVTNPATCLVIALHPRGIGMMAEVPTNPVEVAIIVGILATFQENVRRLESLAEEAAVLVQTRRRVSIAAILVIYLENARHPRSSRVETVVGNRIEQDRTHSTCIADSRCEAIE